MKVARDLSGLGRGEVSGRLDLSARIWRVEVGPGSRVLEEIRDKRLEEPLDRHERGHLTQAEVAEMLG